MVRVRVCTHNVGGISVVVGEGCLHQKVGVISGVVAAEVWVGLGAMGQGVVYFDYLMASYCRWVGERPRGDVGVCVGVGSRLDSNVGVDGEHANSHGRNKLRSIQQRQK